MTAKFVRKALLSLSILAGLSYLVFRMTSGQSTPTAPLDLDQVLSWLPVDTETVTVARGDFVFPGSPDWQRPNETLLSDKELVEMFEGLPLGLFMMKHGSLSTRLKGAQVTLAVEGARHFRPPSGLGEAPYEGCAIAAFNSELNGKGGILAAEIAKEASRVEQIRGEQVSVFQEKLEEDTWTIFVAFPGKQIILVATNKDYLSEVLSRFHGKVGEPALPKNLPEWKHINVQGQFWGLRHFDRSQAKLDATSPFGGKKTANFPDDSAIGLTFGFDPAKGDSATITYITRNGDLPINPDNSLLAICKSPEAIGLDCTYRELAPGVLEGNYTLKRKQSGSVGYFLFFLEGFLGHAIYL